MTKHEKSHSSLMMGGALLVIVIFESMFLGNTFGLKWHSPKLMYQISAYLVPVKIVISIIGLYFLSNLMLKGWRKYSCILLQCLGVMHIFLLSLVCLFYLLFDFAPLAKQFRLKGNIAVFTADPGAMGRAYHYFSFICHNSLGFYSTTRIDRLDWLGSFEFMEQGDQLLIQHTDHEGDHTKTYSLADYHCNHNQ